MIDQELLDILACPACKEPIRPHGDLWLVCDSCLRRYPIRDGIPILMIEEAERGDSSLSAPDKIPS